MTTLTSLNPSNYEVLGTVQVSTQQDVLGAVQSAREAQPAWASSGLASRVAVLREAFLNFAKQKEEFALLASREMGMPLSETLADFDASLDYATWYLDNAALHLSPEVTYESESEIHEVHYEPIGVAGVIVPWNFPFANFVWGAVQSLIAGNAVVFKHSEECPLSAEFIAATFCEHLPLGVFSMLYGGAEVGDLLANAPIDMIAFTGSTTTGKYLYELAGRKFIKAAMELGGSAPGVVFADGRC